MSNVRAPVDGAWVGCVREDARACVERVSARVLRRDTPVYRYRVLGWERLFGTGRWLGVRATSDL